MKLHSLSILFSPSLSLLFEPAAYDTPKEDKKKKTIHQRCFVSLHLFEANKLFRATTGQTYTKQQNYVYDGSATGFLSIASDIHFMSAIMKMTPLYGFRREVEIYMEWIFVLGTV